MAFFNVLLHHAYIIQWSCREGREILEIGFVQNDWSGENETHVLPSQTEDNSTFNSQSSSSRTANGSNVSGMVINYQQTWNQQIQYGKRIHHILFHWRTCVGS